MTLEELRNLRDIAAGLRIQLLNSEDGSEFQDDLYRECAHAIDAYEGSAINYVDALIDAMPVEVKS